MVFQLAEVAVPRTLFAEILRRIEPAARIARAGDLIRADRTMG